MTKTSPERREQRQWKLRQRTALLCGFYDVSDIPTPADERRDEEIALRLERKPSVYRGEG